MLILARPLLYLALTLTLSTTAGYAVVGQTKDAISPSGSISGRVTLNGKPMPGIHVVLMRNEFYPEGLPVARVTTDQDGRFRIANVLAGSFRLVPFAPAFVFDSSTPWEREGKRMTISPGEAVDGVDVSLRRGGVITGKISDSTGRPIVEEWVSLIGIDEQGRRYGVDSVSTENAQTDDRGVYRIFGVPEGRYIVSVGEPPKQRSASVRGTYSMTFHPGVTDESKAAVIEVAAGAESTGVDIVVGRREKAYTATGRIVDAETGKPVSNYLYGYGVLHDDGRGIGPVNWSGMGDDRTDARGSFRLEGLPPNHYAAFVIKESESEYYSDIATFDITDADVSGLEVKVRRGASISGVAAIEGLPDRDVPAKLAEVRLRASTQSKEPGAPFSVPSKIGPDGNFRIAGLRPGRVRLWLSGYPYPLPKGFLLMRVERNGVEQPGNGFDIAAGEQVSAVRVVIAYGNGVIRGQLKFVGETLPPDSTFGVQLNRVGTDSGRVDWWVEVDDRNRFLFEGIPPGDYELIVTDEAAARGSQSSRRSEVKRRVTVSNDAETEVTIIMEPGAKDN